MFSASTKAYFSIVMIMCVVSIGAWVIAYTYINNTKATVQEQLVLIATAQEQQTANAALAAKVAETEEVRTAVEGLYLNRDDVIAFLATIESFASVGVEVTVDTLNETNEQGEDRLEIRLSLIGAATAVRSALDSLEALPYASYLDRLNLSVTQNEAGLDIYDVDVSVIVALLPEKI